MHFSSLNSFSRVCLNRFCGLPGSLSTVDPIADMLGNWSAKAREKRRQRQCVFARRKSVRRGACVSVLGVVREMSLLLRVTDINLWESCTLEHTHTEGKRESGLENAI